MNKLKKELTGNIKGVRKIEIIKVKKCNEIK